jgi:hypothetical protein
VSFTDIILKCEVPHLSLYLLEFSIYCVHYLLEPIQVWTVLRFFKKKIQGKHYGAFLRNFTNTWRICVREAL